MRKDYYAVLGIKPGVSEKEIRSAYKRLARRYHPDVNPNDRKAADRFREITEAYEVLSDPEKRQAFDGGAFDFEPFMRGAGSGSASGRSRASGRKGQAGPFQPGGGAGGFGGILDELMRGMGGAPGGRGGFPNAAEQGPDLQCDATLSFEEAVLGTTLTLPLARNVACDACGGSGMARGTRRAACSTCHGGGTQRSTETIQARIPPGIDHGARVRVPGKGEAGGAGTSAGDLYISIAVTPHAWFRREGPDILLDLPLSFSEAALGALVEVPTLGGRVTLTVPPGSRSGQKLRLRGRGVPAREPGKSGDQIVSLQIVSPRVMDDRSKSLIEELDRLNPVNPRADLGW